MTPVAAAVATHATLCHAHFVALAEAARLAALAAVLIDSALVGRRADVVIVTLDAPLEESLAALAGPHPVVVARRVVVTHGTEVQFSLPFQRDDRLLTLLRALPQRLTALR